MTEFSAGIEGHLAVQKSRGQAYQAEVTVRRELPKTAYRLILSGRIDGILHEADGPCLEEIKTTRAGLDQVSGELPVHWAQVKAYGALYAAEHQLDGLDLQLTYYELASGAVKEFRKTFRTVDLENDLTDMVEKYCIWLDRILKHRRRLDAELAALPFPFPTLRPGQADLMDQIAHSLKNGKQLLIQAPTGLGKTLAALYPAVRSLAADETDKIFFLTARTPGRIAAEQTLTRLANAGSCSLKWISLTAKEKLCPVPGSACTPEDCPYARDYYTKIDAVLAACYAAEAYSQTFIQDTARREQVCPFELSLDLALLADVVICDYNYVFDPQVQLRRFFLQSNLLDPGQRRYALLIDEAHNLPDRAREMYSAALVQHDFASLKKSPGGIDPAIALAVRQILDWFRSTREELEIHNSTGAARELPDTLLPLLTEFRDAAALYLVDHPELPAPGSLSELYFSVVRLLRTAENYDQCYATCYEKVRRGLSVKLFCIDPARHLQELLKAVRSVVFFSATLAPFHYFKRLFGCDESAGSAAVPAPFAAGNLCVLHYQNLSVRYRQRKANASAVAAALRTFVSGRQGNYLLYFPSYEFMLQIHQLLLKDSRADTLLLQESGMSETDRAAFLNQFQPDTDGTTIGLAVMGGIFGESIDLAGERLTGVAVVGAGLPAVTVRQELIRDYFDSSSKGFEYAYQYPGMSRVLQAAGRVIRSENDRGALLLIDDRFAAQQWQELMPEHWQLRTVTCEVELKTELSGFWHE
ncbi:MAG: ATP-dependent DNA helicase [FCB group bacterium]|nr:ATP-dependent DNA helicase [FCB group bacterium]